MLGENLSETKEARLYISLAGYPLNSYYSGPPMWCLLFQRQ